MKVEDLYISGYDQVVIRKEGMTDWGDMIGTVVANATEEDYLGRKCHDWQSQVFTPLLNEDDEAIAAVLAEIALHSKEK